MQNYFKYKLLIISIITITACQKWDIYGVDTSGMGAEYAIPVLEGKTSFQEVLTDFDQKAFFEIAPDGQMTFYYKGPLQTRNASEVFATLQQALALPIPLLDTVTRVPMRASNGVQLTKIVIKSGEFVGIAWLPTDITEALEVTISAPQLTKNGQIFSRTFTAYPNALLPSLQRYDVSGYTLTAQNDAIYLKYEARKRSNGELIVVPFNPAVGRGLALQLSNLAFGYTEGWLGQTPFLAPRDTIEMNFFEQWKSGEVKFVNPSIDITLDNSFGIPVKANAKVLDVITVDNQTLSLKSNLLSNLTANYPSLQEVGQSKRTVLHFDKTNSNIDSIINSKPTKLDYWIEGITNPDTALRTVGFVTDSSFFKMQVEIRLPIWASAKDFEVNQTYPLSLSNYDKVDYVELKINTENEMPIRVGLQGYFATENNLVIDSLYSGVKPILTGAPVDALGNVTGTAKQTSWIRLDADKFTKVRKGQKMLLKYTFETTGNGTIPVKIKSQQQVQVQIGMKVGLK